MHYAYKELFHPEKAWQEWLLLHSPHAHFPMQEFVPINSEIMATACSSALDEKQRRFHHDTDCTTHFPLLAVKHRQ